MTLRARLVALASAAVALAILAASVAAWFLIRATLLDDVDQRLLDVVPNIERLADRVAQLDGEPLIGRIAGAASEDRETALVLQGAPIGMQAVGADGEIEEVLPPGDIDLSLSAEERELLQDSGDPLLRTETVAGDQYRVLSVAIADDAFLRFVRPLNGVNDTLTRMGWLMAGVAGAGVVLAGALGWTITRAGLRPVRKLVTATENIVETKDLAHRIDLDGDTKGEVAQLAGSVNAMLAALDGAAMQQRRLVEDAGHELRTPLATLRNDLGLLIRAEQSTGSTMSPEERAALLRDLESEAASLSTLVAEVVDLARGDVEPEPPLESDMRALVDRAVARTRRVNPEVSIEVNGETFEACVRPHTLERAVANLVRNAVQVSRGGGRVEVALSETAGTAEIAVRDRGPGLSEADMARMFDRFYRGAAARERSGSGLGLAIVAQVADQHSGTVEGENRDGRGAVFTLRVPLAEGSG